MEVVRGGCHSAAMDVATGQAGGRRCGFRVASDQRRITSGTSGSGPRQRSISSVANRP